MSTDIAPTENWLMDDDVNLFDSLACLMEDGVGDENDVYSDLETTSGAPTRPVNIKQEKTGKGMKKRKFNPDSDVIAAATDETLKTLELDPNSKEGKQKRRQIRNRLSAQFHRDRKNAHINTLEDEMARKDNEICSLKEQIAILVAENEYLKKLNPSVVLPTAARRDHAMSMGSYSTINTDSEDGENSVQSMLFYLNGGAAGNGIPVGAVNAHMSSTASTYSGSSLTASPHSSPFHSGVEASVPGFVFIPETGQVIQRGGVQGSSNQAPTSANGGVLLSGAGQGMLQMPTGLARPLSLITMVCMVSIMLLGGQQGPNMSMSSYQYSQPSFGQYQLGGGETALTVGSELLGLMQTGGARVVETRTGAHHHHHSRRLSEESDSDEGSVHSASENTVSSDPASSAPSHFTFTPEEVSAAAKGVASLNLESTKTLLSSLQDFVDPRQNSTKRHNNLRRSLADMQQEAASDARQNQTVKQSKRQVIYSSGVVSRGLVEDSYLYPAEAFKDVYMGSGLVPHSGRLSHPSDLRNAPEDNGFAHASEYHWPASQAFDYAVQSYSKVVLTQGQALLDPSLNLEKNPFSWTRSMFHPSSAESELEDESEGSVPSGDFKTRRGRRASPEPTITESEDADAMDLERQPAVTLPVIKLEPSASSLHGDRDSEKHHNNANAVVAHGVLPVIPTHNLPAVVHPAHALSGPFHNVFDDEEYDSEVPTESSVMHKLLAESNFMTLKLPASSIRVGKTWSDSKDGTVESLMEVFNISQQGQEGGGGGAAGHPYGAEASVEINCIILGAKLVVSQPSSV